MAAGKGQVYQAIIDMSGQVSPSLGKSIQDVEKKLSGVNVKALAVGAAIGAIAVSTAAAVGQSVKYLAELGDSYNSAVNDISAATGLVGDELDGMADIMKDVYRNNFGESMDDVAAGLSEVYRTTGLVDDELQNATESGFALQDTFGYDLSESARAASALMKNFGLDAEEAYNLIAVGAQNGADQNGDLLDTLNEYSAQYAALGLNADQFVASLISGNEAGVFSIDKVGDAVKEFNIRSKDLSESSATAFEQLGFNADDMFARFAAGGDTARTAMFEVIDALQATEDAGLKNSAAVALFGSQYEDLEANLLPVLQTMQGATLSNVEALEQINSVKYDNLTDAFEGIKRQAEVALLPMASTIANAFCDIAPIIGELFEELGPIVEQTTKDLMPFVTEFLEGAVSVIRQLMPYVKQLFERLMPVLGQIVEQLLPPLLGLIEKLLPPLMDVVTALLPPIMSILVAILPMLVNIVEAILPALVIIIEALTPLIEPVLEILMILVNEVIMPLLPVITSLIESLLPILVKLIEALLPAITPLLDVLVMLVEPLSSIIEFIGKIVGWVADGLTWVVDILFDTDGKGSAIRAYSAGGFTDGISIAGEAGTEAIISFDPAYRSQNLAYWAKAGQMLGADSSDYSLDTYSASQSIDIGGIEFAPEIVIQGDAKKEDIIAAIEETYPEFVDLIERVLKDRGLGVYV